MDYEEKYNNLLGRLKALVSVQPEITKGCFLKQFPELKESEDERIIYDAIKEVCNVEDARAFAKHNETVFNVAKRVLEKQGEQKPTDKVEPKFKAGDCIKPIDSCLGSQRTICEVCDGWYVTNQGTLDFEYENNWELVEQKPVEWNEEDEEMLNGIIVDIEVLKGQDTTKDGRALYQKEIDWLKSIKDRVQPQPKQEWSEEDEKLYNDLSDTYFYNDEDYPEETYKLMLKRVLDWMTKRAKSIRPQNRWKPSDEQMNNK